MSDNIETIADTVTPGVEDVRPDGRK